MSGSGESGFAAGEHMADISGGDNAEPVYGLVADIERGALHDGPGIRTAVFMKGCPLDCAWCHNPECISPKPQTLYYPEKCVGCGHCADGCHNGARVVCGKRMTPDELLLVLLEDREYYGDTGGLTLTGGEPLMQPAFARELIRLARRERIGVAVETSLYYYDEELLKSFDLIMFDLKLPDDERHRKYTGVGVTNIKEHIRAAARLGVKLLARTPIVPGVNADIETIAEISDFLYSLPAVYKYELLPYHPLGRPKREALGLRPDRFDVPDRKLMEELNRYAFVR